MMVFLQSISSVLLTISFIGMGCSLFMAIWDNIIYYWNWKSLDFKKRKKIYKRNCIDIMIYSISTLLYAIYINLNEPYISPSMPFMVGVLITCVGKGYYVLGSFLLERKLYLDFCKKHNNDLLP